jgi:adenylate kinase family enzyme
MNAFDKYPHSKLVGISGTFCAGKDTAANHLVEKYNFLHVSTGDVLRAKAAEQGRDITDRRVLIETVVELRKKIWWSRRLNYNRNQSMGI